MNAKGLSPYQSRFIEWSHSQGLHPWLSRGNGTPEQNSHWLDIILAYATYIRLGGWNNKEAVTEPNVVCHLTAIVEIFASHFLPHPLMQPHFGDKLWFYDLRLLLKTWKSLDGPVQHKNPIPASIVIHVRQATKCINDSLLPSTCNAFRKSRRTALLIECAFTMLWRPQEYTGSVAKTSYGHCLSLSALTLMDRNGSPIFMNGALLDTSGNRRFQLREVLLAESTSVNITHLNQKNGEKGDSRDFGRNTNYNAPNGVLVCPVNPVCLLICDMVADGALPETLISAYLSTTGWKFLTGSWVTTTLRAAVKQRGVSSLGFSEDQISAHSLRAGGAYALFVCGVPEAALRMMGRWKSDAFMSYIRAQHDKKGQYTSLLNSAALTFKIVNSYNALGIDKSEKKRQRLR